jgi:hypothetical protein
MKSSFWRLQMDKTSVFSLFVFVFLASVIAGNTVYLAMKKASAGITAVSAGASVFCTLLFMLDLVSYLIKAIK